MSPSLATPDCIGVRQLLRDHYGMDVLLDALVHVQYRFLYLAEDEADLPDLTTARAGQRNGLCGANAPGVLSMIVGRNYGRIPVRVEWHDAEPPLAGEWEEVVEVPFRPTGTELALTSFDDHHPVRLPGAPSLRARFCGTAMDAAGDEVAMLDVDPSVDRYLLALWPADPAPETVVRQTSDLAGRWHEEARSKPVPDPRIWIGDDVDRYEWDWRDRPLPDRLRALGGDVLVVAEQHRGLLEVFASWPPEMQRDATGWLAGLAPEAAAESDDPLRALVETFGAAEPILREQGRDLVAELVDHYC
ncbi:hypothetical protein Aco03nite_051290 [Actinoplanes couchii]|uniref:Uncharacterized protein n=2 Tax=Actinoplanes couchii TaxID=403638 RepID=A0ABQ3XDZ3_9ACTN|nr:hypothetical protein Aco03nite_051290 [Actinoplanes couchii]